MRIEGTLTKWNDDRGFGFITPSQGGPEVFVHISAFPKNGRRPTVGGKVTFEIKIDHSGKKRAKNLLFPDRSNMRATRSSTRSRHQEKTSLLSRIILLVIVAGLALYGYKEYSHHVIHSPQPTATVQSSAIATSDTATFRCDGRIHCSQMTSCTEAKFFLRNCPNVKMDGNGDGVPCEQQWCTSPFAQ